MKYLNPSSATFWTGVGLIGYGIARIVTGDAWNGSESIFEGLGLIFLRRAIGAKVSRTRKTP